LWPSLVLQHEYRRSPERNERSQIQKMGAPACCVMDFAKLAFYNMNAQTLR